MMTRYIFVDGAISGTGIRDAVNGGYIDPKSLNLSEALQRCIDIWISDYEDAHYSGFNDIKRNDKLDEEGVDIANLIRKELPEVKVRYFSSANMREILF